MPHIFEAMFTDSGHIKKIAGLISKYYKQVKKTFMDFLRLVEKASGKNPERYKTLIINRDDYAELRKNIHIFQEHLAAKIEGALEEELPCILYFHNPGYIQDTKYPTDFFHQDDILRITYELTGDYRYLSKEYMLQHFTNKGLIFPMRRSDVITFLLDFDNIIEGL